MKQISRKIAYAFVSLATLSVSAAVPQLSISGKEGSFTHVELPEGFSVLHSSDEDESVPEMILNLPTGRMISMPVNELESCKIVNTSIPAFNIHFTDYPHAEQLWLKEEYINATLDIHGNGVVEDQLGLELTMKGRGNTTWNMAKKPMRLKFAKKTSLCGFKKAKNYVLLANYIDQTHMHNSVAMWLGQQIGVTYTNHFQTCMQIDLVNGGHTFLKVDNDLRLDVADGSVSVITYNPPITVTDLMKVPAEGYWKLNYDLQDVVGFKYVNLSLAGVGGVVADAPVLDFNGNVLSIETGKAGRCIIYSLDGTVEDSISFEGTTQIDMSRYGKGVHVIKIDENEPLKINIR